MDLTDEMMVYLAIGSLAASVVATALGVLALAGQRRVRRAYRLFTGGSREDVVQLLGRHVSEVRDLRGQVAALSARSDELRDLLGSTVSRVATLRYDAFADMGGHMSYSTALLDERGNGVVLTSIHGRSDTRTYAKPVRGGRSEHTLSEEEATVIERALGTIELPEATVTEAPSPS